MQDEVLVIPAHTGFKERRGQLGFGIGLKDKVNVHRADLGGLSVRGEPYCGGLVTPRTQHGNRIEEQARGMWAKRALHDLRALDPLEREPGRANVVKNLGRVPVDDVSLIPYFHQRLQRIGVGFRRTILQRVNGKRVGQLGDDDKFVVNEHKVAVDPDAVFDAAKVRVGDLRERRAVIEIRIRLGDDAQLVERVRHRDTGGAGDGANRGDGAILCHGYELRAHHPVYLTLPEDAAAVDAWACAVLDNAICRSQIPR